MGNLQYNTKSDVLTTLELCIEFTLPIYSYSYLFIIPVLRKKMRRYCTSMRWQKRETIYNMK